MRPIKVLLTACGCPGASTLIRMIKQNGERELEIIGVDADDQAIGRFLADEFLQVPLASSPEYIPTMINLVKQIKPDVLFPESSLEVPLIAEHKTAFEDLGTAVLVSTPESINISNNKLTMYRALESKTNLNLPQYRHVKNLEEFNYAVTELGYPKDPVCFKPLVGKGSRGFRILDSSVNRKDLLLNHKPNSRYISLSEFTEIFKDDPFFPDLLVMEYIDGTEYTTDALAYEGELLLCATKTVESARWGVIVKGKLVNCPDLVEQTKTILNAIKLSYNVNLQFIEDQLIEINPRVSSFIFQDNLIFPYLAIKVALGELSPSDLKNRTEGIAYGRRMLRYMDQVFWEP